MVLSNQFCVYSHLALTCILSFDDYYSDIIALLVGDSAIEMIKEVCALLLCDADIQYLAG